MQWISVEDGLPDESDTVLTFDGSYMRTAEILYEDDDGTMNWIDGGVVFDKVTYWMPLPPSPKHMEEEMKKFTLGFSYRPPAEEY